ncbi:MAG: tRNA (adenosine(37)-N6)-dimethylallyltransferase MiaA [Bacteroidetes bacterium]|nr:tRNA (adenosine(37)-N6)-dimethylallyltransferase MiaA [Bacteroidota bacterium]
MRKVLAIVGPTASGKTRLSAEVAKKINGEIISADSRQIYKHIPVASSYPSAADLNSVRHYFINELEPGENFNAGEFGKKGRELIDKIFSTGKQAVITGGSGLYIRSVIDGLFESEIDDKGIREGLYEKLEKYGEEFLYDELKRTDEDTYAKIPKGKIRRVIRALEVYYASGKKISEFHKEKTEINFETIQIGLMLDRKYLYERINARTDEMLLNGLLDEVKLLKDNNFDYRKFNSLNTVGIKEVFKFLEGEYDYETMVAQIKQNTRRYAKRQMTWFRRDERIKWINVNEESDPEELSDEVIRIFNNN